MFGFASVYSVRIKSIPWLEMLSSFVARTSANTVITFYLSLPLISASGTHVLIFPGNSNPNESQTINDHPAYLMLTKSKASESSAGDMDGYEPVNPPSRQVMNVHASEANMVGNEGDICGNEHNIYDTLFEGHIYGNEEYIWCMLLFS